MRILVTGGAGFIGSHFVDLVVCLGGEVVVVDDLSSGKADNLPTHRSVELVRKSFTPVNRRISGEEVHKTLTLEFIQRKLIDLN